MGYSNDVAASLAERSLARATLAQRQTDAEIVRGLKTTLDGAVVPSQESASELREVAAPVPHD